MPTAAMPGSTMITGIEQLQEGGEHDALLRFVECLLAPSARWMMYWLKPQYETFITHMPPQQHREAGQILVVRVAARQDHVEFSGKPFVSCMKAGNDRRAPPPNLAQRQEADDEAAEHQQRHLHDVGERDRLQSAVKRVEHRRTAPAR